MTARTHGPRLWRAAGIPARLRGAPVTLLVGLLMIAFWVAVAIGGPLLLATDPSALDIGQRLLPPSVEHLFGTDNFGRDIFTRVIYGSWLDLQIGIFSTLPAFLIGTVSGLIAGYRGGVTDTLVMRLVDILTAFPFIVLVIAIVAVLGPGIENMYFAVALVGWIAYAKVTRNSVAVTRRIDYISAARVLGFRDRRILLRHILPNVIVQVVVLATGQFVGYILLGSALGYLGLGVIPPQPEWGVMIAGGREYLRAAPWTSIFPGLAIMFAGAAFLLLGDGLSDILRPEEDRP